MSTINHSNINGSLDHHNLNHRVQGQGKESNSPGKEDEIKKYYIRLINEEFRNLQLDPDLQSKSLFDLIDYCELLYEDLTRVISTEKGLKTFIKGYLIFNYFINRLIMMHFDGFDEFIKSNERDFIIYLHLFTFYNTDDYIKTDTRSIPLGILRKWILGYLIANKLLNFDVHVLYDWLYEYIDYLKEKDEFESQEQLVQPNQILKSQRMNNINANITEINSSQDSLHHSSDSLLDLQNKSDDNESLNHFKNRYPAFTLNEINDSSESLVFQPINDLTNDIPLGTDFSYKTSIPPQFPSNPPPIPSIPPPIPSITPPIPSIPPPIPSIPPPISSMPPPIPFTAPPELPRQSSSDHYSSPSHSPPKTSQETPYPVDKVTDITTAPYPVSNNVSSNSLYYSNPSFESYDRDIRTDNFTKTPSQGIKKAHSNYNRPSPGISRQPQAYNNDMLKFNPNGQTISYNNQNYPNQHAYANPLFSNQYISQPAPHIILPNHALHQQNHQVGQKINYMMAYSICGLKNFGSSCYINLTIQLLFGLFQFKAIFANLNYVRYIKDPKFLKIMKHHGNSKASQLLSEAISGLLKSFQAHGGAAIAPTKFLRISSSIKPDFNIPNEQQDAQEFLLFVLERLHDELSYKVLDEREMEPETLERYIQKWNININIKDKEYYLNWYKSLVKSEGNSPINDLFQGHLQNKLICNKCGYESTNYSPFTILSLPIPDYNVRINLSDCLRYYTQDETLSGDNAWNCPKCSKNKDGDHLSPPNTLDNHPVFTSKRSGIFKLGRRSKSPSRDKAKANAAAKDSKKDSVSVKTLNFIKLPQILFIHLSRFSMTSMTDKVNKVIKYPLELKFNNYSNNINHEITYKLVGLINHYGNLKSGHYTSLVNKAIPSSNNDDINHPCWCYFDDDAVRINLRHGDINKPNIDFNELNSRDVYVLCYERR
jgi:ubiquitin carboxyl-terminal hydrolase 7/11